MVLPRMDHSRKARAIPVQCPNEYCSEGIMVAQCSDTNCPSGKTLPSCWFALVKINSYDKISTTQYLADRYTKESEKDVTHYLHITNSQMSCLPCCILNSNDERMPRKIFMQTLLF